MQALELSQHHTVRAISLQLENNKHTNTHISQLVEVVLLGKIVAHQGVDIEMT